MNCNCKDWADNIKKLNGPIVLQTMRSGVNAYDGKQFSHCPWCGSLLYETVPPPHRRFEITIKCGGDTKFDTSAMLQDFLADIEEDKTGSARGGCSAGGFFEVKEYPEMTHEKYCVDLKAHLDSQK